MALQVDIEIKGVTLSYHKIISYCEDAVSGDTIYNVGAYKDADVRASGVNNYLDVKTVTWQDSLDNTRSDMYTHLKTLEGYETAEDI
jgi:hypothetical protein